MVHPSQIHKSVGLPRIEGDALAMGNNTPTKGGQFISCVTAQQRSHDQFAFKPKDFRSPGLAHLSSLVSFQSCFFH